MKPVKVPGVVWSLGDREQYTASGDTVSVRTLYYQPEGAKEATRVGTINSDFEEQLMDALGRASSRPRRR